MKADVPVAAPALGGELGRVLRAATAAEAPARDAARAFVAGFDHHAPVDPSVYAALPAVQGWVGQEAVLDDPRANLIRGVARQTWTRNQLCLAAARSALEALARVDVAPVVLPGAVTGMAATGDLGSRVLERIDVLIEAAHVPRVVAALLAIGAPIHHGHASLLAGRVEGRQSLYAPLSHGGLLVRWDHPLLGPALLSTVRAGAQPVQVGPLVSRTPAAADALVVVLADLSDGAPIPLEWTNLVLELARLGPAVGDGDPAALSAVAVTAHTLGRHAAWTDLLRLVADVSATDAAARVAERFAAVAPLPAADPGPAPPRTAPGRAARMAGQYRAEARRRGEPVTVRGLARWLHGRWRLADGRGLPREAVRRIVRARRPVA